MPVRVKHSGHSALFASFTGKPVSMFYNYLKIIIRNGWRSKGFTFINLFGLACGMSVCLLILLFVQYERGYDRHYKPHVYRLCAQQQKNPDITRDLLNAQKFDGNYIPLITAVAFFVLLLGIINYINIHTARLLTRAKEVGIRKTSGAGYRAIVWRFLAETGIYVLLAFIGAVIIIILGLPLLARLMQRELNLAALKEPSWPGIAVARMVGRSASLTHHGAHTSGNSLKRQMVDRLPITIAQHTGSSTVYHRHRPIPCSTERLAAIQIHSAI